MQAGAFLLVVVTLGLLAGALGLLFLALRGARVDRHPICRKCRFDLSGLGGVGAGTTGVRCPECGRDVSSRRAVRLGNRRRRKGRVVAASGLVGLAILLVMASGWTMTGRLNWYALLPAGVLFAELDSSNITKRDASVGELSRRLQAGGLSLDDARTLAAHVLAVQADPSAQWTTNWGHAFERIWLAGLLSDEDKASAVRNGLGVEISAWSGDQPGILELELVVSTSRLGPTFAWVVERELISVAVDQRTAPLAQGARARVMLLGLGRAVMRTTMTAPDGDRALARCRLTAGPGGEPLVSWEEDFAFDIGPPQPDGNQSLGIGQPRR